MGYSAVLAVGATYGVIQGERSSQAQKRGLRLQAEAQKAAMASARKQEAASAEEYARANRRQPDIGSLLMDAERGAGMSSLLSGPGGVANSRLKLGRPSLLGG